MNPKIIADKEDYYTESEYWVIVQINKPIEDYTDIIEFDMPWHYVLDIIAGKETVLKYLVYLGENYRAITLDINDDRIDYVMFTAIKESYSNIKGIRKFHTDD